MSEQSTCPKCQAQPQDPPCQICEGTGVVKLGQDGAIKGAVSKPPLSLLPFDGLEYAAEVCPSGVASGAWLDVVEPLLAAGYSGDVPIKMQERMLVEAARAIVLAAGDDAQKLQAQRARDKRPDLTYGYAGKSYGFDAAGLCVVAWVLQFGLDKGYKRDNWRGLPGTDVWDALLRHVYAARSAKAPRSLIETAYGPVPIDWQSGLPEAGHAACCILFLLTMARVGKSRQQAVLDVQRAAALLGPQGVVDVLRSGAK